MKNLKTELALITAITAMSFTFVSRSGVAKIILYTPEANCYKDFKIDSTDYTTGDFVFITNPTTSGCGVQTSKVKQNNSLKIFFGDLLNNSVFSTVTPGTLFIGKCDETLNAICCFHINPKTRQILDVCSGRQVLN